MMISPASLPFLSLSRVARGLEFRMRYGMVYTVQSIPTRDPSLNSSSSRVGIHGEGKKTTPWIGTCKAW